MTEAAIIAAASVYHVTPAAQPDGCKTSITTIAIRIPMSANLIQKTGRIISFYYCSDSGTVAYLTHEASGHTRPSPSTRNKLVTKMSHNPTKNQKRECHYQTIHKSPCLHVFLSFCFSTFSVYTLAFSEQTEWIMSTSHRHRPPASTYRCG